MTTLTHVVVLLACIPSDPPSGFWHHTPPPIDVATKLFTLFLFKCCEIENIKIDQRSRTRIWQITNMQNLANIRQLMQHLAKIRQLMQNLAKTRQLKDSCKTVATVLQLSYFELVYVCVPCICISSHATTFKTFNFANNTF